MSGFTGAVAVIADIATSVLLRPKRGMTFKSVNGSPGGILIADCTIEENHQDTLIITQHPVQRGAMIADHSYKVPATVTVHMAWSNSSLGVVRNLISGGIALDDVLSGIGTNISDIAGTFSETYASTIYSALLKLQSSREPMTLSTGKRSYDTVLMVGLGVSTTAATEYSLMVTATFQEILIVDTQITELSPDQSLPADTASPIDAGVKAPATNPTTALYDLTRSGSFSIFKGAQ